jgi:hypothetical protein
MYFVLNTNISVLSRVTRSARPVKGKEKEKKKKRKEA